MEKQKKIYENISKLLNHNNIIHYIHKNNIVFTENNNGLFINLSILSDNHINNIYHLVSHELIKNSSSSRIVLLGLIFISSLFLELLFIKVRF